MKKVDPNLVKELEIALKSLKKQIEAESDIYKALIHDGFAPGRAFMLTITHIICNVEIEEAQTQVVH